jgi:hypothetical protein
MNKNLNRDTVINTIAMLRELHAVAVNLNSTSYKAIKLADGSYRAWSMIHFGAEIEGALIDMLDRSHEEHAMTEALEWCREHNCKTAACALGWAGTFDLLPDLKYMPNTGEFYRNGHYMQIDQVITENYGLLLYRLKDSFFYDMDLSPIKFADRLQILLDIYDKYAESGEKDPESYAGLMNIMHLFQGEIEE